MAAGNRCGQGCDSSTLTPAVVYFPSGTYKISGPIITWYYSQMIGDAKNIPVILAASNFAGMAMIGESRFGRVVFQTLTHSPKMPIHTLQMGNGILTRTMYAPPVEFTYCA